MGEKVEVAMRWARENGAQLANVRIAEDSREGLGLEALSEIGPDSILMTLHCGSLIHFQNVEAQASISVPFSKIVESWQGERHSLAFLKLFMVFSRISDGDRWSALLGSLSSHEMVPSMWQPDEIEKLKGSSIYLSVIGKVKFLREEFRLAQHALECNGYEVCFDDWLREDALLRSRAFDLKDYGPTILPILDFANHSDEPNARWEISGDSDTVTLVSNCALNAHSPITISYGDGKGSGEYLYSYGFVPEGDCSRKVDYGGIQYDGDRYHLTMTADSNGNCQYQSSLEPTEKQEQRAALEKDTGHQLQLARGAIKSFLEIRADELVSAYRDSASWPESGLLARQKATSHMLEQEGGLVMAVLDTL